MNYHYHTNRKIAQNNPGTIALVSMLCAQAIMAGHYHTRSWENLKIASSSRERFIIDIEEGVVPLRSSFTARTWPLLGPDVHSSSQTIPKEPLPSSLLRCHLSSTRLRHCPVAGFEMCLVWMVQLSSTMLSSFQSRTRSDRVSSIVGRPLSMAGLWSVENWRRKAGLAAGICTEGGHRKRGPLIQVRSTSL